MQSKGPKAPRTGDAALPSIVYETAHYYNHAGLNILITKINDQLGDMKIHPQLLSM